MVGYMWVGRVFHVRVITRHEFNRGCQALLIL